jgi:hypothetical protein
MWRRLLGITFLVTVSGCEQPGTPSAAEVAQAALDRDFTEDPSSRVELFQLAEVSVGSNRVICGRSSRYPGYPADSHNGRFVVVDGRLLTAAPPPDVEAIATACLSKIPNGPEIRAVH